VLVETQLRNARRHSSAQPLPQDTRRRPKERIHMAWATRNWLAHSWLARFLSAPLVEFRSLPAQNGLRLHRWYLLFRWLLLGALVAPSFFGQQAPQNAPAAQVVDQEIQTIHNEPPGNQQELPADPATDSDPADDPSGADEFPSPPPSRMAPDGRSSLDRQTASIQRQLGRARQTGRSAGNSGSDNFFVSAWFTGKAGMAASAAAGSQAAHYDIPSECDPLDRSLAEAFMRDSATREGVSLDLVREVIRQESGFQPCVVSSKGAMGMMQLMPDTANALGVIDPFDPRQNIDGGVRLLRRLLDKYQGRPDLALAAYNAGEGAVDRNNAVPDYEETRDYVRAIMRRVFEEAPEKPRTPRAARIASPARIPSPSFGTPAPVEAPATDETP
jgi:hypothetical protein